MATTIDQLEIEVQSSAQSAVSGIDALASSLGKLKTATRGGAGLTALSKQLTALNTALNGIDGANVGKLESLSRSLQSLSSLGRIRISSSVANQITNLGTAVRSLDGTDFSALNRLASSLIPLANVGRSNLSSFVTQLTRLPTAIQGLSGVNLGEFTTQVQQLSSALAPLSQIGSSRLTPFINQLNRLPETVQSVSGVNMGELTSQIQQLVSALAPLSELGRSNMTSFINQLNRLPEVAQSLRAVNIGELASQIRQLADSFRPLGTEMSNIASGFSALPRNLQTLIQQTNGVSTANERAARSYVSLAAKVGIAAVAMRRVAGLLGSWINKSNEYIESMNLVGVSLGEYAQEAKQYAETVADAVGIDPAEWLRNQGVFNTLAKGFGVTADRAAFMSKNLTQLGYDLSSFFNIPISDAMQKVQSGLAGELEPLRRIGYDLSTARLQQEAYTLGIQKKVSAMTQAEKAELRYYAIMKQVSWAHGDMARTVQSPANQIRILKMQVEQCARAFGNLFIPVLQAVLPPLIAVAKVVRFVINVFAGLFGIKIADFSSSMGGVSDSIGGAAGGAGDLGDSLGGAAKKAKELKNALLGIDELNVISPPEDSAGGGGGGAGGGGIGGGGLDFDLPGYDFLEQLANGPINDLVNKILDWLGILDGVNSWAELFETRLGKILELVMEIAAGLAAWKIAKGISNLLDKLANLKFGGNGLNLLGLLSFADNMRWLVKYIEDILSNGANLYNVSGVLTEFAAGIGTALALMGKLKVGAAFIGFAGAVDVLVSAFDMLTNGINYENVLRAIRGLSKIAIAIGIFKGDLRLVGAGIAVQGLTTAVDAIREAIDETGKIDWSKVDWASVALGTMEFVGGTITFFKGFKELKDFMDVGKATEAADTIKEVTTVTETIDTSTTAMNPKLTSLAKDIGMGVLILGELAVGAILFAGAIAVIGMELSVAGAAWLPVIANGGAVAIAIVAGTAILAGVGFATNALGSVGKTLAVNIAIGTAILLEIGVSAGLFIAEIWAIGLGLNQIGTAWQPVISNGQAITQAILIGTGLLVGIGVATAALGTVTIATGGTLPVAIGIGTALLVELSVAVIAFTESLVAVANEFTYRLSPALANLNAVLPQTTDNLKSFTGFMGDFAGAVWSYTGSATISGLGATVNTVVEWFTADPFNKLTNEIQKTYDQAKALNGKLNLANPELQTAIRLLKSYNTFVSELGALAGSGGTVNLSEGFKVNLKSVGESIVTGFADGIKSRYSTVQSTVKNWGTDIQKWFTNSSFGGVNREKFSKFASDIINGFKSRISSASGETRSSINAWATSIKDTFKSTVSREAFETIARDVVTGFKNGITSNAAGVKSSMTTWGNDVKKSFSDAVSASAFTQIGKDVVTGFNNGVNSLYYTTASYMRKWAAEAKAAFKSALDSHSPSKVFMRIGYDTVLGYNNGIEALGQTTKGVVEAWTNSFTSVSPVMSFAVDTSALKYYSSDSFAKDVSAEVTSNKSYSFTGFREGMEEFYHEFIEPTMTQMADDVRRQADKKEQTIVKVGNRTITDAVTTQQKANGYSFVK